MEHFDAEYHKLRKRNFFWPAVLIAAGLILLLENFGLLSPLSFGRLWPIILIIWGLDILWRRYHGEWHNKQ